MKSCYCLLGTEFSIPGACNHLFLLDVFCAHLEISIQKDQLTCFPPKCMSDVLESTGNLLKQEGCVASAVLWHYDQEAALVWKQWQKFPLR